MIDIQILDTPLNIQDAISAVSADGCGALVTFTGTVRNKTAGRKVIRLEYECYKEMALKEMTNLGQLTCQKYAILHISIHHGMGSLIVGDIAVNIVISAAHRADAFAACQFAIDTLKQRVPIWKKEVFEDGEVWVSSHA